MIRRLNGFTALIQARKILTGLRYDGGALAPATKRRAQDAFAFALAVDVRSIEEANASIEGSLNEMESFGPITA